MSSAGQSYNLLISGANNVGKTSLALALARGLPPPVHPDLPKRFEGWVTSVVHPKFRRFKPRRVPQSACSDDDGDEDCWPNQGSAPLNARHVVNFTLWEDWPRKAHLMVEEDIDDKEEEEEEEEDACSSSSSTSTIRPTCVPPRPCLSPRPDVIVLCFSHDEDRSMQETEDSLWPELRTRYPATPIVLVATKCDLRPHFRPSVSVEDVNKAIDNHVINVGEAGAALARRIGATAYLECSAKLLRGLSPVLDESVLALESGGLRSEARLHSSLSVSSSPLMALRKKKHLWSPNQLRKRSALSLPSPTALAAHMRRLGERRVERSRGVDKEDNNNDDDD